MSAFNPDGPHSPDLTREAAERMAELARFLAYATSPGIGGLDTPNDVERVVRSLAIALSRLPQSLRQSAAWLRQQADAGAVGDASHPDPSLWARVCVADLTELAMIAEGTAGHFERRANDLSSLYQEGEDD